MALVQTEADALLVMPKAFLDFAPLEFSQFQSMDYDRALRSQDRREEFLLTIERGRRKLARLKYQTRARRVIVLARLDIEGPRHRNPPDSPHRPGERLGPTHLHLYREGFEDRIAYELHEAPQWQAADNADAIEMLQAFMRYCGIQDSPPIQVTL